MIFPPPPRTVLDLIREAGSVVVAGHSQPDGDCLYSCLALGRILSALGKETVLVNEGPFDNSETRPLAESFLPEVPRSFLAKNPLVVIADCSDYDRTGAPLAPLKGLGLRTVVLDHHSSHEDDSRFAVYRVPKAISTTLIVHRLAEVLEVGLDEETARFIFRGFLTDSGCFRYLDASQNETYKIIAGLASRFDLSTSAEMEALTSHEKPETNIYLCRLLRRCGFFFDGRLAISCQTKGDLDDFPLVRAPSNEFFRRVFTIEGVEAIVLLKATGRAGTEIGLRSSHKSRIDVGAIASGLGGGGHAHAAGARLASSLDEARTTLMELFRAFFEGAENLG